MWRTAPEQVVDDLREALAANPKMRLQLVGHSMGGGTAAILTMMCAPFAALTAPEQVPRCFDLWCLFMALPVNVNAAL